MNANAVQVKECAEELRKLVEAQREVLDASVIAALTRLADRLDEVAARRRTRKPIDSRRVAIGLNNLVSVLRALTNISDLM